MWPGLGHHAGMRDSDAALIQGFLVGDRQAVETVSGWIRAAAWPFRRRLGDRWDDLVQEILLEVTRLLSEERFRGASSLKTYLWRVASHTGLDQMRAEGRVSWQELEPEEGPSLLPPGPSHGPSVGQRDLLLRVLEGIPTPCRRLWRMVVEGWSYREMSTDTGVSEGALRVRVLRCRRQAIEVRDRLLAGM